MGNMQIGRPLGLNRRDYDDEDWDYDENCAFVKNCNDLGKFNSAIIL